jgi:hypothetical protein
MPANLSAKPEVCPSNSHKRESRPLLVQDNTQERSIDLKSAVVLDESQLSEFVHEEVNPWACCADHLRQRFPATFWGALRGAGLPFRSGPAIEECGRAASRWS